jgi:hypothetical protein
MSLPLPPDILQISGCSGQVKEKSTDFELVEGEEGQLEVMPLPRCHRRENEHVPAC